MSHDVSLPFSARPKYPDFCVRCGRNHPEAQASIKVLVARPAQTSLLEDGLDLALGSSSSRAGSNVHLSLAPPACSACSKFLWWEGVCYLLVQYLGPLAGVGGLIIGLALGHNALGFVALALGICAPVLWSLASPPALSVTVRGEQLIYEFRRAEFAQEFRRLNGVADGG